LDRGAARRSLDRAVRRLGTLRPPPLDEGKGRLAGNPSWSTGGPTIGTSVGHPALPLVACLGSHAVLRRVTDGNQKGGCSPDRRLSRAVRPKLKSPPARNPRLSQDASHRPTTAAFNIIRTARKVDKIPIPSVLSHMGIGAPGGKGGRRMLISIRGWRMRPWVFRRRLQPG
jgi:hypothetical protein